MATKKDYEIVANAIRQELDRHKDIDLFKASSIVTWIIANLCREFAFDNPTFDKDKFIDATCLNEYRARNSLPVTSITE